MRKLILIVVLVGLIGCLAALGGLAVVVRALDSSAGTELPYDGPPVATSTEAALRLVEKATAAGERAAKTGSASLTVTQEEVTSFLNIGTEMTKQFQGLETLNLQELGDLKNLEGLEGVEGLEQWQTLLRRGESLPNLRLSDLRLRLTIREPMVYFKGDGRIVVRGYVGLLRWRWPVRIVVAPRASDGELVLDFVEGTVGSVDMPEFVFDLIGKGLARALLAGQEYASITQISVGDGTLTIAGRYKKSVN